ncbi:hypothetical protein EV195_102262 [Tenacibaculum skagerrakense]|uniref:Cysteine rich repeat protein n=1 Tax=Tenacibaculum skagerrakense TaxID=186571 RepID=A0A4R2NXN8_9FLAO|nr:hypothetical protein [Tenacibaculum skagerrakense]TCP26920.1 hypothetical protein EV195_102262 [Tenacibaculum skagerrakense]
MKNLSNVAIAIIILICSASCSNSNETSNNNDFKNDNCNKKWTEEVINAAIEACIETDNSLENCTCAVETTAKELTICETETTEGLAKQLEISLACGIQPQVE